MKKVISLLLALCLVLALAACGGGGNSETKPSEDPKPTDPKPTDPKPTEPENPYAGTEIEVWGVDPNENVLVDISKVNASAWYDMVLVAMMEWCDANDVTLKWGGTYNQATLMAAVAGGHTPDLLFTYSHFPNIANLGITKPLTEEGYAKIAENHGTYYLDVLNFKGQSHGVMLPTNGTYVCYYNRTLFDEFGVKTPKELWLEGNWNWDTFVQTMKDVTKDLDGDGVMDTYGMASNWIHSMVRTVEEGDDGKLKSLASSAEFRKYADIVFNGITEGYIMAGTGNITSQLAYPRPMMMFKDCSYWNLNRMYYHLSNDDYLEVVPIPKMSEDSYQQNDRLTYSLFKLSANDNEAATEAMMDYVMQCASKYISDVTLGAVPTEFEGIQGTCPVSELFLVGHKARVEKDKALQDLPIFDHEYNVKFSAYLSALPFTYASKSYAGVDNIANNEILHKEPAASSVAKLLELHKSQLDKYNSTYIF